jgi:NADH:ubiquinone oxidoreductase subunit 2 (subunit N)
MKSKPLWNDIVAYCGKPGQSINPWSLQYLKIVFLCVALFFFTMHSLAWAEEPILVFPTTSVDVYAIYTSLIIFWIAIISLIVIIKMKLKEIERIQKLGIDKEESDAPLLEDAD